MIYWLLGLSVVFIIILLLTIVALTVAVFSLKADQETYLEQWDKWERRYYDAQNLLMEKHELFLSINCDQVKLIDKKENHHGNNTRISSKDR